MRSLFILIFFTYACNNSNDQGSITDGEVHANANDTINRYATLTNINGCYEMVMNRDTALLKLTMAGNNITGNLIYKLFEKDKNEGEIKGEIRDSLIYADYTFQSEGTTSVREVIFKISGNNLIPAYGDLEDDNGKIIFSDHNQLQYLNYNPFIKIECK
ncbi:MAG: hypothetical protein M3413_01080 [Bacteroidota bacterium]|jgi:hypothetical protein|nr:hypothetical protein [Bacteroidota bacterium]